MQKRQKVSFSTHVPMLQVKGSEYKPDFLLAIKEGAIKLSILDEATNISQLISRLDDVMDLLKDIRWAQNKKVTQGKK